MKRFFIFTILYCVFYSFLLSQNNLNLGFEMRNYTGLLPKNWLVGGNGYKIILDSLEKHAGNLSLKMEMSGVRNNNSFGFFTGKLPVNTFAGKNVEYREGG